MPSLLETIAQAFEGSGVAIESLGLAWARAMPAVILVPAFGLRAMPVPLRAAVGLAIAVSIYPAMGDDVPIGEHGWAILALGEVLRGVPIALAAAIPLWAATMAGGLADNLGGFRLTASPAVVEGQTTGLGAPLSILASAFFLFSGGPARIAEALAHRPFPDHPLALAAHDLTAGVTLAVSLGAPLLAAAVIFEVAGALLARATAPTQVQPLLAPLRSLALLVVTAIVLERLAWVLRVTVSAVP